MYVRDRERELQNTNESQCNNMDWNSNKKNLRGNELEKNEIQTHLDNIK